MGTFQKKREESFFLFLSHSLQTHWAIVLGGISEGVSPKLETKLAMSVLRAIVFIGPIEQV